VAVMLAAAVCVLVAVPTYSGSASARSCTPAPISRLAETAIAGRVYANGGPRPRRGSCEARFGRPMTGVAVRLVTPSGRVIKSDDTGAGGVYRFAVRPGLYRVSAYLARSVRACESKIVRVRRDERKVLLLSCSIP
jgi:hypothetical protein